MAGRNDIETLQDRVYAAKRVLEEMKTTPQPIAGDSWVFYRHDARPNWDYEILNITDPTWKKLYKITYQVPDPSRGFMNIFFETGFQFDYQGMSYDLEPVGDDPFSWWLKVKHVDYNSDPAGIRLRFYTFATQKGELVITEQVL